MTEPPPAPLSSVGGCEVVLMTTTIERIGLGIPVTLLGAIWSAFGLILKGMELLNEARDGALGLDPTN